MASVMIVDDTAVDRRLAGGLLEGTPDVEVVYAENGKDALEKIELSTPDLVVTDLQMPELDGLQLVTELSERYPDLPVILMTAHGSESIAAQALANGASSFVPKADLAENLVETVRHILAMSETENTYKKLVQCTTKADFEFNLDNDPAIIEPLVDMIQQIALSQGVLSSQHRIQMAVALENALTNAMFRGNMELSRDQFPVITNLYVGQRKMEPRFKDRKVYVRALVTPESVQFTIRDSGPGFDIATVPQVTDPESYRDGIGRGLVLIQAFMDEVEFSPSGNEINMTKHRSQVAEPASAA